MQFAPTSATSALSDEKSPPGSGGDEAPPPSSPDPGGDDAPVDNDTLAERGALLSHWDDVELSPSCVLRQVESEAGRFDGQDRQTALASLDALGAEMKAETAAKADAHDADLRAPAAAGPAAAAPAPAPAVLPDRGRMRADVERTAAAELKELDADLAAKEGELAKRFGAAFAASDADAEAERARVDTHAAIGSEALEGDILRRRGAHSRQITAAKSGLDADVAAASQPLSDQAELDATAAADATRGQQDKTRAAAQQHAADIRAQTQTEAKVARDAGGSEAAKARAAAAACAARLGNQPDEARQVVGDGERRAEEALRAAQATAESIEKKGAVAAAAALKSGSDDAAAQGARGEDAAQTARANGRAGQARVAAQAEAATEAMNGASGGAAGRMEAARTDMEKQSAIAARDLPPGLDREQARLDAEASLRRVHDKAKARIEASRLKNLERIDHASPAELARTRKAVDGDLETMAKMADGADARMGHEVEAETRKLEGRLAQDRARLRAGAARAIAAIDRFVRDAKRNIALADKTTSKEIAAAAQAGHQAIADEGARALTDVAAANQDLPGGLEAEAQKEQEALARRSADAQTELSAEADGTSGAIEKKWLDDALDSAGGKLDDRGVFNVVTPGEATAAMNILASLPGDLQGQAIDRLDADRFTNLVDRVPAARGAGFEDLVAHTTDPRRKVRLWKEFYTAQARNDAAKLGERQEHAAASSGAEAEAEMEALLARNPDELTVDDVTQMTERKALEHHLEMKYGVELTAARARHDGSRVVWTSEELLHVDKTLAAMPPEHVADITDIRRVEMAHDKEGRPRPGVGARTDEGHIRMFDAGTNNGAGWRQAGDSNDLSREPDAAKIDAIDETLAHEAGHAVHNADPALLDELKKLSGWQEKSDLRGAPLTPEQIQALRQASASGQRRAAFTGSDGKVYMNAPYGKGFLVVDETALPEPGESEVSAGGHVTDSWDYARSDPKDHFAELYSKAVNSPEKLRRDLVALPKEREAAAQQALEAESGKAAPDAAKLSALRQELDRRQKARGQQESIFEMMRTQVFHADSAIGPARERLVAAGATPDQLAAFDGSAGGAATPAEVEALAHRVRSM